ncbi:MAG: serine/threonine protein kinase [Ignavibacterium sp.]|nr:MAG: serine/threonine protein kinase [Ignavibacterium sp.]
MLTDSGVPTSDVTPESQVKLVLSDRYEILEEIGRGAMASVYKAVQKNLNRTVALKVVHRNLVHNSELLDRFHREAQVSASLNHPNLVTIYDEGAEKGIHYMSMEYIDGVDVQTLIKNKGKLGKEKTINIIATIAEALDYTHSKGLIHRDIKSSNILLTENGRCVLTDFGLAHAASGSKLTQTGTVMGTPDYMSPEQAEGKVLDKRTDIYSLGVVMYECLTGVVPFKGDTIISTIYNITSGELKPLIKVNPTVPVWLSSICTKMLSRDIDQRFQSAIEVARAIRARKQVSITANGTKKTQETKSKIKVTSEKVPTKQVKVSGRANIKPRKESKKLSYVLMATIILLLAGIGFLLTQDKIHSFFDGRSGGGNWSELSDQERKKVEILLNQGDDLYILGRLVTPSGSNAAHNFREALRYHRSNQYAQKRMRIINDQLVFLINKTMLGGQFAEAEHLANASLEYYPTDNDFNELKKEIAENKRELELRNLFLTDRDSAYVLANVLLELDSNNTFANYVLEQIKIGYLSQGDSLLNEGKLKDAKSVYNKLVDLYGPDDIFTERIKKTSKKKVVSKKIKVPNVIGMSVDDAVNLLIRSGLTDGKISRIASAVRNKNMVINQVPKSGRVKRGTAVNLIVGE